jgi:hypothetical protein
MLVNDLSGIKAQARWSSRHTTKIGFCEAGVSFLPVLRAGCERRSVYSHLEFLAGRGNDLHWLRSGRARECFGGTDHCRFYRRGGRDAQAWGLLDSWSILWLGLLISGLATFLWMAEHRRHHLHRRYT